MTERQTADFEDLAAFIDGRLSGERKAQVEERLLRDEDYYEVFLETVRFREEHGRPQTGRQASGEVVPGPAAWWRSWRVAAPLAAAAVLVAAIGPVRLRPSPSAADWVASFDAASVVAQGANWDDPGWSRTRSAGPDARRYEPEERAFRLGARTVDLRVALAAGDRAAAARLAAQAEALTNAAGLFPMAQVYEQLRRQIDGGEPDAPLLQQAAGAERHLAESFDKESLEARRFALGQWAEAGRLSALTRDARALARIVRRDPGARSIEKIAEHVETLESILERPDPGAEDFAAAASEFKKILYELAG